MPTYEFQCLKCGAAHEVVRPFKSSTPRRVGDLDEVCCHGNSKIQQIFYAPDVSVRLGDSEVKTIGHLADRNSSKFSDDYKSKLAQKNKTKRSGGGKLPEGMERVKPAAKDTTKIERIKKINKMSDTQKKRFIIDGK